MELEDTWNLDELRPVSLISHSPVNLDKDPPQSIPIDVREAATTSIPKGGTSRSSAPSRKPHKES